jgi:mutual gliding-motility protein MglA
MRRVAFLAFALVCVPAAASFINYSTREINLKLVYTGPSGEGATQSLEYIYARTNPESKGKMIKLALPNGASTLFYDFVPASLGEIRGFKVRFHLYTTIGGPDAVEARKLILKGVDGIVFVADSDPARSKDNVAAFTQLKADLSGQGYDWQKMPIVFQFDHRDHPKATPVEQLKKELGVTTQPGFESVAPTGVGIFDTLKGIAKLTLLELKKGAGDSDAGAPPARTVAPKP